MRKLLLGGLAVLGLLVVLVGRTLMVAAPEMRAVPLPSLSPSQDQAAMVARLSRSITFPTVSGNDEAFVAFHAFLRESFPLVHEVLSLKTFDHSLLFHWDSGNSCKPTLLLAHQDVVPVSSPADWKHPPFSGAEDDGYIWGRGTMDDKVSVMAILEAVEGMLAAGEQPSCDVWLAFGHDEETGGMHGAARMAAWLLSRGLQFELVLDEGGMILPGSTLGIREPVALIGIAEKGYLSVQLRAYGEPGHSSRPPVRTAIGELASAIQVLESSPRPASLGVPTRQMLEQVAPWQPFGKRLVFANLWLFKPLVLQQLASKPETNAMIRTTLAPTMLNAGVKDNVLPGVAQAVINFRLLPGERSEDILAWLNDTLPPSVKVKVHEGFFSEASDVSPTDSDAYQRVAALAAALPGEPVPTPFLLIAGSDARHYQALSGNVLRFLPVSLQREDIARFHGPNERLARDQYAQMVRFYSGVIQAVESPFH